MACTGETFRSLAARLNEHKKEYNDKKQLSINYQCSKDQLGNTLGQIDTHIFSKYPKTPF